MSSRRALLCSLFALAVPPGLRLEAQPPVVEERLEVREVGILADLPADLRGATREELARRIVVLENGLAREVMSVDRVGGASTDAYSRVVVLADVARCSDEILLTGAAAFGAHAGLLVALGPVELVRLGEETLETLFGPSRSSADTAEALAALAGRERCGPAPAADRAGRATAEVAALRCAAPPCLLAWIGPGWGAGPEVSGGRVELPASAAASEPLARELATKGWTFLAAPIAPAASGERRQNVREPAHAPGSDRYTFGVNVLARDQQPPLTADEYERFVDLWLAPLRRLVGATAGEFVERADRLPEALTSFARRSIVYYRAERRPGAEPPRLEVREPGTPGRSFRAPEWAPGAER